MVVGIIAVPDEAQVGTPEHDKMHVLWGATVTPEQRALDPTLQFGLTLTQPSDPPTDTRGMDPAALLREPMWRV